MKCYCSGIQWTTRIQNNSAALQSVETKTEPCEQIENVEQLRVP